MLYGRTSYNVPSRFIAEIPEGLMEYADYGTNSAGRQNSFASRYGDDSYGSVRNYGNKSYVSFWYKTRSN